LSPEMNNEVSRGSRAISRETLSVPVELKIRLGSDVTGKAALRVLNPARRDASGVSDGVPIEIVDEVLPPKLLAVRDASDQELIGLLMMNELSIKADCRLSASILTVDILPFLHLGSTIIRLLLQCSLSKMARSTRLGWATLPTSRATSCWCRFRQVSSLARSRLLSLTEGLTALASRLASPRRSLSPSSSNSTSSLIA